MSSIVRQASIGENLQVLGLGAHTRGSIDMIRSNRAVGDKTGPVRDKGFDQGCDEVSD